MINIRQLIIARYATVSPVIKMSNMRGFGIHIVNYFCLSNEEIENQCKKIHKPTKPVFILWYFLKIQGFFFAQKIYNSNYFLSHFINYFKKLTCASANIRKFNVILPGFF